MFLLEQNFIIETLQQKVVKVKEKVRTKKETK